MKRSEHLLSWVGRMAGRSAMAGAFLGLGFGVSAQPLCSADAGTLGSEVSSICFVTEGVTLTAEGSGDSVVPEGFNTLFVLTEGADDIIMATNTAASFDVDSVGEYTIHTLVYDPATLDLSVVEPGVTTAAEVNALLIQGGGSICASLDLVGASIQVTDPEAGGLTATASEVCLENGMASLSATPDGDIFVPEGYSVLYVLSMGEDLVLTHADATPSFMVETPGLYRIHTLVYDSLTLDPGAIEFGTTTGLDVHALLVQGGGTICASLDLGGAVIEVSVCGDCPAFAGSASAMEMEVCLDTGPTPIGATVEGTVVPPGFVAAYVLTLGEDLVIQELSDAPLFNVTATGNYTIHTLVYDPATLDLSAVELGVTGAGVVNGLLIQGGGEICGSLDVEGATVHVVNCPVDCLADAGMLTADSSQVCLEGMMASIGATGSGTAVPEGYSVIYVLTSGGDLVIEGTSTTPDFTVDATGMYTIHTLVYDPATLDLSIVTPGETPAAAVNALLIQGGGEICGSLDLEGAMVHVVDCSTDCTADAGMLTVDASEVCLEGMMASIGATASGTAVPEGYSVIYVLTSGGDLVIEATSTTPDFTVDATGMYTIHTLVYDPATLDLSIVTPGETPAAAVNALLIQGGGEICGSLDLEGAMVHVVECGGGDCTADAGTLFGYKPTDCLQEGGTLIGGIPAGNAEVPAGYQTIFVLTEGGDHTIVQTGETPIFNVTAIGEYTIHTLVYDPATLDLGIVVPGVTTAAEVNALLVQGDGTICASLDLTGTSILVDNPSLGMMEATDDVVCLTNGMAQIGASVTGNYAPEGYEVVYVLTNGSELVIEQVSAEPSFIVDAVGSYTIHTLIHDPATLDLSQVVLGVTTGSDVNAMLFQGGGNICAVLDVAGASVMVDDCADCTADAGSMIGFKPVYCYEEAGTLIGAIVVDQPVLPPGFVHVWLATHGDDHVIEAIEGSPFFTVSGDGLYTIHTLVYDPAVMDLSDLVDLGVTTAAEIDAMLIQGGGEYCGSLDMEGVWLIIDSPDAGTLSADAEVCLDGGSATLNATNSGSYLPLGYAQLYLLAGSDGTVLDTSSTASFTVDATGSYTIHTLVHDPATFDLGSIVPGSSSTSDLNAMLVQGGGLYCAALDLVGATIDVIICGGVDCTADAGSTTPDLFETCLSEGTVTITAEGNGDISVPAGYATMYLLSTGMDMTIVSTSASGLSFTVEMPGTYYFHTLVYNPSTFDPAMIEEGTTMVADLDAMFVQGGGEICASLDVMGASTMVIDCTSDCFASGGTIVPDTMGSCMTEGSATLLGIPAGDIVVPPGYSVAYILTQGLSPVYHSMDTVPSFTVTSMDIWRIHTFVYDPLTFDASVLVPGETTVMDVNAMLVQGGGSICAGLDIYGAMFTVVECSDCEAFAGTLTSDTVEFCLGDSAVWLNVGTAGDAIIPDGFAALYILTMGPDHIIVNVSDTPGMWVELEGDYTIHTLVYDPFTLSLGFLIPGETTATELLGYIMANQDAICASLDLSGIELTVVDCDGGGEIVNAWPVPAVDQLNVELSAPVTSVTELQVIDVNGMQVLPIRSVAAGSKRIVLDVAGLGAGHYVIRMINNESISNYSFSKLR